MKPQTGYSWFHYSGLCLVFDPVKVYFFVRIPEVICPPGGAPWQPPGKPMLREAAILTKDGRKLLVSMRDIVVTKYIRKQLSSQVYDGPCLKFADEKAGDRDASVIVPEATIPVRGVNTAREDILAYLDNLNPESNETS